MSGCSVTATAADLDTLAALACEILIDNLRRYGSRPNAAHIAALRQLCTTYAGLALGGTAGRIAVPLDTGMGKTESIVAFCAALHRLGHSETSIVVCQSRVEALCELMRKLIAQGIPPERIGLMHSKQYDPSKLDTSGRVPSNAEAVYASLPASTDCEDQQFLLVTHSRVRGRIGALNQFEGKPRSLVIWDESLIASEVDYCEQRELKYAVAALRVHAETNQSAHPAAAFFENCLDRISDEYERQYRGQQPAELQFADLSDATRQSFAAMLQQWDHRLPDRAPLLKLLEMIEKQSALRVVIADASAVVQYHLSVPLHLDRIVVLDASWPIRLLEQHDQTIRALSPALPHGLKRYDQVRIRQMDYRAGRTTVDKEIPWLAREVAQVVKAIPPDEGVLIFVFKQRGQVDHSEIVRKALGSAGVDLHGEIEVGPQGERTKVPRINLLTWGQETGLNEFAHCTNVILVGILHRKRVDIAGAIVGQRNNILHPVSPSDVTSAMRSELAHSVFQALGRGSCRVVEDGRAKPMNAWLLSSGPTLKDTLQEVMPGAHWEQWAPYDQKGKKQRAPKAHAVADLLQEYLARQRPDTDTVSIRKAKADLGLATVGNSVFQDGRERAMEASPEWSNEGRSFVRRPPKFPSARI
jgi:hypothetical protein